MEKKHMEAIPHKGTKAKERLYVLYTVNAINRFPSLVNQKRHLVSAPPPSPRQKKTFQRITQMSKTNTSAK